MNTQAVCWQDGNLILHLHVQTRANKDEFAGFYGAMLKVRIQAVPVDGKANRQLRAFLAKQFAVSKTDIVIISGQQNRKKRIQINSPRQLPAFLAPPKHE